MTLTKWIQREGRGAVTKIHFSSRLAINTITDAAKHGAKSLAVAKKLSKATGGEVTVAKLLGLSQ